jgi:hypothetical protein
VDSLPVTLGVQVRRFAYKRGSIPRAVVMPSFSPHALRPSTFRAPGWGAPALPCSCCRWRSVASWRSAPFSHRSASRIFIVRAESEGELSRVSPPVWAGDPLLPPIFGGEGHPPSLRR